MKPLPTRLGAGVAAVAMAMTAVPASANAFPCFDESTVQSARIHDLRVMLMVNALKCREIAPTTLRAYGSLLEDRYGEFAEHSALVQDDLIARFGPRTGQSAFDDYETRIGNYHSGVRASRDLCADTATHIALASRADHGELEMLSKLTTNRSIATCAVARTPEPDRMPRLTTRNVVPATGSRRSAVVIDEPEMVDGIPTYNTPGIGIDTAPEPMEPAVVVAAAPERKPQVLEPTVDRYAQAIEALDAAANALREMQRENAPTR